MKITTTVNIYCESGFYCMRNGEKKCGRLNFYDNRPYCEIFRPLLETDRNGNVLKCEHCLLAERKARLES